MPESPLARKLRLKACQRAALWNAVLSHRKEFGQVLPWLTFSRQLSGTFDRIQVLAKNRSELRQLVPGVLRAPRADGLLLISFPKSTSSIQTDLTRDDTQPNERCVPLVCVRRSER
jgi:hypothetical protein